jgi:hypothetical protein
MHSRSTVSAPDALARARPLRGPVRLQLEEARDVSHREQALERAVARHEQGPGSPSISRGSASRSGVAASTDASSAGSMISPIVVVGQSSRGTSSARRKLTIPTGAAVVEHGIGGVAAGQEDLVDERLDAAVGAHGHGVGDHQLPGPHPRQGIARLGRLELHLRRTQQESA